MSDWKDWMDRLTLSEGEREIGELFRSLAEHPDVMKRVVLASFLLRGAKELIEGVDPDCFLAALRQELSEALQEVKGLSERQGGCLEHVEKNRELIGFLASERTDLRGMADELDRLLARYDGALREAARRLESKSIAELEAERKGNGCDGDVAAV